METLTIHQPYATLLCLGLKEFEFRSWKTSHRGNILIHAGATDALPQFASGVVPDISELTDESISNNHREAFADLVKLEKNKLTETDNWVLIDGRSEPKNDYAKMIRWWIDMSRLNKPEKETHLKANILYDIYDQKYKVYGID